MIKVIVHGFSGRLGSAIGSQLESREGFTQSAGVDVSITANPQTFPVFDDIFKCDMPADVLIDCSTAFAVPRVLEYAVKNNMPVVVCTTGLSPEIRGLVQKAAEKVPVFQSANMSLGINLLADLVEKASRFLGDSGFDIEIVEKHHNQKIDAPSGTALLLADAVNEACGNRYEYVYDRTGRRQTREKKELGIHSVRGGTIIGEHSIIFAGKDEVIEINHSAASKEVFATGALKAAEYIINKAPGIYNMRDLIKEA